jgi:hypothetical protein
MVDSLGLCWGKNEQGQLGNGTNLLSTLPVALSGLGSIDGIATGDNFTCAIGRPNNTFLARSVYCWGEGDYGQLGIGRILNINVPAMVDLGDAALTPTPTPTTVTTPTVTTPTVTPTRIVTATVPVSPTAPAASRRMLLPLVRRDTFEELEPNNSANIANPLPARRVISGRFNDAYDVYVIDVAAQNGIIRLKNTPAAIIGGTQLQAYAGIPAANNQIGSISTAPYELALNGRTGKIYVVVFTAAQYINPLLTYQIEADYIPTPP